MPSGDDPGGIFRGRHAPPGGEPSSFLDICGAIFVDGSTHLQSRTRRRRAIGFDCENRLRMKPDKTEDPQKP
ncbi:hypothetical protein [Croceicoccus hydrothermalis]|uniref:hypothetical protein n=1 Tax=Croceicoccus hydrothermalis TaxID=2867964 RepID=UPI001EFB83FF|nr:hypothetical protein [Croceicoccus hydrothermalis]